MDNELNIIVPEGCDNAPRKQIVIAFTVAMFSGQTETLVNYVDDAIVWHHFKEHQQIESAPSVLAAWQEESYHPIERLEISQVITHGKFASINGVLLFTDNEKIDFCEVFTFTGAAKSAKVKELKSYRV